VYKVTVIIPVLNEWEYTFACLSSLRENTCRKDVQVIVVDNGSSDKTPESCAGVGKEFFGSRFKYIRLQENINFGPACNLGASYAQSEFLFFLNNDTKCTPGWLEPLLNAFNGKTGAVGPLLLYPESDLVQHLGISFTPTDNLIHLYHCIPAVSPLARKQRKVQALTAAAFLIPAGIFRSCGGFYAEYKNGYEDIDLCLGLGREGYELKCVPQSRIYHYTSISAGRFDHHSDNSKVFTHRSASLIRADTHVLAGRDGLEVFFSDFLQICYRLPGDKSRELENWGETAKPGELLSCLDRYPYWEKGYALAREVYKRDPEEVFYILSRQSLYFPLKPVYGRLLKVARQLGREETASFCRRELRKMENYAGSREYLKRVKAIRNWAQKQNDARLMRLYRAMRP